MNTSPAAKPQPLPEAHPRAYLVLKSSQLCRHCHSLHESSQIMLRCELPARFGIGAAVTQIKALSGEPQWSLPIEQRTLETKRIPFCHECMGARTEQLEMPGNTVVSHLPPPPQVDTRQLKPVGKFGVQYAAQPDKPVGAERSQRAPNPLKGATTDQLLGMLEDL